MTDRKKKPGVEFWATVALVVVLAGYPLSFGPACWWLSEPLEQSNTPLLKLRCAPSIYWPIQEVATHGPRSLCLAINWYATLGLTNEIAVYVPGRYGDGIVFWGPITN